jgi:mevalonate pyrophosphate decarboxylase
MPITNFLLDTSFTKIVNYSDKRTVIVIANRDSVNKVEITYEPNNPNLSVFTLDTFDVISFIRELGDETDRAIYARATSGTAKIEVIEQFGKVEG